MRRLYFLLIWLLLPAWLSAQTDISTVEYWYDADYGTASRQTVSGSTVNYTDLLDVSSLVAGLHTLTVRVQDSRGVWGSPLVKFFTYDTGNTPGLHFITDVEYWYDNDYSSAVETTLTPGTSIDWNSLLDVSTFIDGLHTLTCRFKDDRGTWGTPLIRFFKKEGRSGLQKIVALEYWLDDDYADKVSDSFAPTALFNLNQQIDVSALPNGLHFFCLRLKDESGRWNAPTYWYFTKYENETPVLHQIMASEYWFDGDYSSVQTDAVSATTLLSIDTDLDVSGLSDGIHYVSSRYRDESGNWSPAYSQLFAKYPSKSGAELHKITELQYWFDGDYSSVQTESVSATAQLNTNTTIDISALNDGLHVLTIRYRDEAGNWSPAFSNLFAKYLPAAAPDLQEIVMLEYWIDGDISSGKTTRVHAGSKHFLNTQFDVSGLNNGLHILSYRFQDEAGKWSSANSALFSKFEDEILPADNKIVGYRYWPDNDIASATEVTLATPVKSLAIDELLDVANFPGGTPVASFQFVDAQGNWSSAISKTISKEVQPHVRISADDSTVCLGTTITFSSEVIDADIIEWKFGDNTTSVDFNPEHTYAEAGHYEVTTIVTHTDSAKSAFDTILGGIEVYPVYTELAEEGICESELPYIFGNQSLTASGTYTETFTTIYGCDSVVTLNFIVNPVYETAIEDTICQGDLYVFGGDTLITTGTYRDTLPTINGCDSILTLKLVVNPTYEIPISASICDGNSYLFNGSQLTTEGIYKDTLVTVNGCDSILTLTLTVDPAIETPIKASICEGDSYSFAGKVLFAEGIYKDTLQTVSNCDSIVLLTLTVNPVYEIPIDSSICEGESVNFGGKTISKSGIYKDTLQSALMCDSVIVLNLQVNPVYNDSTAVSICEGDSYTFCETDYNTTGNYVHTLTAVTGCDSVVTLLLTVNPKVYETINTEICQGDSYLFAGVDITTDGEYKDTLLSSYGCDSIVTLNLTVNPSYEIPVVAGICGGDSYSFGGEILTTEGIYRDTLQSDLNCDSVVVLNLTVYPIYEIPADTAICSGSSYSFGGDILTESGIYRDTLQSINSCDSIIILTLTVNDTFNLNDTMTICESELPYSFGNQTLIAAGDYTETFTTILGCDSVVNLTLYINDTVNTAIFDTICENDLPYILGTQSLSANGIYTEIFAAANGCDSVVTLNLTVHESYNFPIYRTVSPSELPYVFASQNLTKTGTYTNTLVSVSGCDSIITLHLLVKDDIPPIAKCQSIEVELSEDGSYSLNESDLTEIAQGSSDDVSAFEDLKIVVTPSTFTCNNLGENTVVVQVSDAAGNKESCQTTIRVVDSVRNPKIDEVADQIIGEDSTLVLTLTGISGGTACSEHEVSLFAEHSNPELLSSLNIDYQSYSSTAILEIVPFEEQFGTDSITVTVKDSMGNQTSTSFLLTVTTANDPPEFIQFIEDQTMVAGDSSTLILSKIPGELFDDPDDDDLIFNVTLNGETIPDWIKIGEDSEQYIITFIPTAVDTGCFEVILNIQDQAGDVASDSFNVCINPLEVGVIQLTESLFEINLYPNPSQGQVNIDLMNVPPGEIELLVTNILGSEILRKTYQNNDRIIFDLSEHISGSYLVILKINQQQFVRKLILDKK